MSKGKANSRIKIFQGAQKQEDRPLNIIVCFLGKAMLSKNIPAWTQFIVNVTKYNTANIMVASFYHANIYHARNGILGGNIFSGNKQRPFQSSVKGHIDLIILLDDDIIYTVDDMFNLINTSIEHKIPILCGSYLREDGYIEAIQEFDAEFFITQKHQPYLVAKDIVDANGDLIPVDHSGLGFCAIKPEVFSKMEYPWFTPYRSAIRKGKITLVDNYSEDTSFLIRAKEDGYQAYLHSGICVNHNKARPL